MYVMTFSVTFLARFLRYSLVCDVRATRLLGLFNDPLFLVLQTGAQVSVENPGKTARDFYPLGPCQHPGGLDQEVSLHPDVSPRQRLDAGQSHEHINREFSPSIHPSFFPSPQTKVFPHLSPRPHLALGGGAPLFPPRRHN